MKTLSIKTVQVLILVLAILAVSSSPLRAQSAEENFKTLCASCHRLDYKKTVGPGLAGLKERRTVEWIKKWISNSQALVSSGDADAKAIFDEYNQIAMPAFPQLDDAQLDAMVAYIDAEGQKAGPPPAVAATGAAPADSGGPNLADPVMVIYKDITVWAAIVLIILVLVAIRLRKYTLTQANANGQFDAPHAPKYLFIHFSGILLVMAAVSYILVAGFQAGDAAVHGLAFAVLPYVAIASFLFGTFYRYKNRGFTVSSLSSQFLEGRQLFWGSQPFHWGIMVLFFGHLIAFLFPRAVMAWNGMPIRLLILEVSSFVFAISALVGLVNLIGRRFSSQRLTVVGSKADMMVYSILLLQILSGLGIALFSRWGSNWFAAVLTPYLRSIFYLNPDATALAAMPWVVKLHVVSAFFIVAIIPFTRFMHFLVAPVEYIWRKYQVVIWNYNPREIRQSTRHTFGKKSQNH